MDPRKQGDVVPEGLLAGLLRVQREIATASGNPIEVMHRIAERAVELSGADRAIVGMLDGDDLVVTASSGSTGLRIGDRVAAVTGFLAECIRSRKTTPCDVESLDFTTGEREASTAFDGAVAVPLVTATDVTGILVARSRSAEPLAPADVLTLQFLAGLLVTAIQAARIDQDNQSLVRDRVETLERIQQSEQRFRSLIENATDAIVVVDRDARATYVSPAIERVTGFRPEEMLGKGLDLLHPDDLPRAAEMHRHVILHPGETSQIEVRGVRKDGTYAFLACVATNLLDDPAVEGIVVNVRDVTRQRRTQESQEYLAALVASSHDSIVGWSRDWKINSWNPGAEQLFGYTEAEALGQTVGLISPPEQREHERSVLERIVRGEAVPRFDTVRVRKDGRSIIVSLNVSPIYDTEGKLVGAAAISRDVTEQRRLEAELRQAQKMEAVGRLAGGIAHDFNNILTAISANAELALDELPAESPVREELDEIRHAGKRAATLTRQLLAFSRKQVLQPVVLSLNSVVSAVEAMLRRVIGEDVALTTVLSPDLGSVRVDPGQIEQVLMNLVVNARDAMPEGGAIEIRTALRRIVEGSSLPAEVMPGTYATLAVTDTGTGMTDAVRSRIFEPFFTTKDPGRGTGLGLATVFGIVRQSGGFITVDSRQGQGTTFTILIPHLDDTRLDPQFESGEHCRLDGGTETILLVEDENSVRKPLKRVLERIGYTVFDAAEGTEALRIASAPGAFVDLLLTDVIMPGMNGREIAERMLELNPDLRIIFMSGYSEDAIATQGAMIAGSVFIEKPFATHILVSRIREVLSRGR